MFQGRSVCFKADGHVAGLNWFINSREPSHAQTRWTTSHLLGWPLQGSSLITGLQCGGGYEMALSCDLVLLSLIPPIGQCKNKTKHWAAMEIVLKITTMLWMLSEFLSERYNPLWKECAHFAKRTQYTMIFSIAAVPSSIHSPIAKWVNFQALFKDEPVRAVGISASSPLLHC